VPWLLRLASSSLSCQCSLPRHLTLILSAEARLACADSLAPQKGNQVMMITLLLVMQRACLWYYTIITYYYVIITQGSIITHYYLLQSAELADDLGLGFRGHIKKKDKPNLKVGFNLPFCDH